MRRFIASGARAWLAAGLLGLAIAAALAPTKAARAADWPDRPIRIIVPAPPGGITDGVARLLGDQLRTHLGQPVIVDNKPGGSAVVAERALMAAPADGHTIMVAPSSILTDFPLTVKTPFDPLATFTYVSDVASMVHVLVANPALPAATVREAIAHAKRTKNAVAIANLSAGTRSHLLGEMLREKSGGGIVSVPYKGSAPALADLIGDQVQLTFEVVSNVAPLVRSGKLKALGVVSRERSALLPDVPSLGEAGYPELVMPDASVGVFVLGSMSSAMQKRIRDETERIKKSPRFREMLAAQGLEAPVPSSHAELQQKLAGTMAQNRAILGRLELSTAAK
ncbi:tripartite tricarboxylate transporter substrate binding protein [Variovorax sp. KK3]|uniref:Bug family tripartite tricarboxylate transporter substrate binding protein n=1 Tax=Variovorax sp. KK3 TaxID=1855728 RepID=UPI00117C2692|nr:tripartite tricarboxylate transporter substrate binding protein [Variovorax sp. KK3]